MLQKFKEHININFPVLKDKKLLIAISGGVDSVVLTHLFNSIKFAEISLAHCNFKLREVESDKDEIFIKQLAKENHIPVFTISFETAIYAKENKVSTQIAARELRYNWFKELVKKHNFEYVLTAHHADDNLETFLINLTRGSGLEGFTGIPKKNGNIVRTLLPFSRDEILKYAQENNITWREDASNASTKYVRNKIRHQVVPILKKINPSLLETFAKTLENLEQSQHIIGDRIQDVSSTIIKKEGDFIKFNIHKINQLPNQKAYLYQLLKEYNFTEWNDIYNLLSAQSGKQIFSKTHRLLKDREFLILSKKIKNTLSAEERSFTIDEHQSKIDTPIPLFITNADEKLAENKQTIYIDKDLLNYPLLVRKWKNGDYLYPTGMQGKKKLSKYFKDEKFSLIDKENTWLLCNANNDIIWVINYRQDRRFLSTKTSKRTLKITTL